MGSRLLIGAALLAAGLGAGAVLLTRPAVPDPVLSVPPVAPAAPERRLRPEPRPLLPAEPEVPTLAQEIAQLRARLAEEQAVRRRLEERLEALAARLGTPDSPAPAAATVSDAPPPAPAPAPQPGAALPAAADGAGPGVTAMERALVAAGVDPATATDLRRQEDALALAELQLRDRATREGWIDTPQFAAELAAIQQQRVAVRDVIGDDAWDRYLFALGATNRIRVDEVMLESPAQRAGLRPGDLVLSYGGVRVFAPQELVDQTRGGRAGEPVPVEVKRDGRIVVVEVPRGPLGVRINATHDPPS